MSCIVETGQTSLPSICLSFKQLPHEKSLPLFSIYICICSSILNCSLHTISAGYLQNRRLQLNQVHQLKETKHQNGKLTLPLIILIPLDILMVGILEFRRALSRFIVRCRERFHKARSRAIQNLIMDILLSTN